MEVLDDLDTEPTEGAPVALTPEETAAFHGKLDGLLAAYLNGIPDEYASAYEALSAEEQAWAGVEHFHAPFDGPSEEEFSAPPANHPKRGEWVARAEVEVPMALNAASQNRWVRPLTERLITEIEDLADAADGAVGETREESLLHAAWLLDCARASMYSAPIPKPSFETTQRRAMRHRAEGVAAAEQYEKSSGSGTLNDLLAAAKEHGRADLDAFLGLSQVERIAFMKRVPKDVADDLERQVANR